MNETTARSIDIAVTGATGQQGGALARVLLRHGHRVRALTRNPSSPGARELSSLGAELYEADLDTGSGLDAALDGSNAVFLVSTPFERGADAEPVQAEHLGRAASRARTSHVVYSSVTLPMTRTPVEHFASKAKAEGILHELGLPLTIIGSPPFLDNVIAPWHLPWLRRGVFAFPAGPPIQMVLTQDIGSVAAYVLEHRDQFVGERLDIATEAISVTTMKAIVESASGRSFRLETKSFAELDPLLGKMFAGLDLPRLGPPSRPAAPMEIDLASLRKRLPGVEWSSFAAWASGLDWKTLLGANSP